MPADLPELAIYYREKAMGLRRKAEGIAQRTARSWLLEAADECEIRAIALEAEIAEGAARMAMAPSMASFGASDG